ncbi:MAG: serine/threonine protein kinase [Deltaproteobacteria bacterium]|nr:serine/threonine protein kinase [Deltaproteobacteria bacterium]MBW2071661.1 serine/threonine protein kinase [Deltaproteobacteria bacterium]
MEANKSYWIAQAFILILYVITLIIYNRAKKEYVGGKIGAAIKLIMVFVAFLFLSDYVDYFLSNLLPLSPDVKFSFKILFRLVAISVLAFGGLRFFVSKPTSSGMVEPVSMPQPTAMDSGNDVQPEPAIEEPAGEVSLAEESSYPPVPDFGADETVVMQEATQTKPSLGRYEIIEELGRGAMGIVYKGHDPKLDRLTAIKTIRFTDDFDEDQVEKIKEQFYREAEVVAKLSHPNIVTIYDVGEDLDLSYLAMEYLEGVSLERYAHKDNLLPIRRAIDVVSQVCDALEYAHGRGIVHRDVKPANIMILNDGLVKVTDFGIARATATSKTRTGVIKGTPYYMSPEQISGMKVDGRSDIFSLGVVFYQLLTGELPFGGENLAAIMYQITTVPHEPPTTYNPKIFKAAVTILDKALEKKLDKRYQSARQMGDHLRLLGQKLDEIRARAKKSE